MPPIVQPNLNSATPELRRPVGHDHAVGEQPVPCQPRHDDTPGGAGQAPPRRRRPRRRRRRPARSGRRITTSVPSSNRKSSRRSARRPPRAVALRRRMRSTPGRNSSSMMSSMARELHLAGAALTDMITRSWLIAVALLLGSCTAPAPSPSPSPLPRLTCPASQNGDAGPSPDLEILLDAAALPTKRVLETDDHQDGWLFSKVGLYVRPNLTVELSVESTMDAGIEYGGSDRSRRIVLTQCTQLPGRWIVYTGGYYVRKPTCLPIRLRVNGIEAVARIAVGAPC